MLVDFLTKHRGIFVTLFVLPISLLFKFYMGGRNRLVFWLNSAPDQHPQKVEKVRKRVQAWRSETASCIMQSLGPTAHWGFWWAPKSKSYRQKTMCI